MGRDRRNAWDLESVPEAYRETIRRVVTAELAWLPVRELPWGFAAALGPMIADRWIEYWVMGDGTPAITLTPWSMERLGARIGERGRMALRSERREVLVSDWRPGSVGELRPRRSAVRVKDWSELPYWVRPDEDPPPSRQPMQHGFVPLPLPEAIPTPEPGAIATREAPWIPVLMGRVVELLRPRKKRAG